jgi:hypothetical protein
MKTSLARFKQCATLLLKKELLKVHGREQSFYQSSQRSLSDVFSDMFFTPERKVVTVSTCVTLYTPERYQDYSDFIEFRLSEAIKGSKLSANWLSFCACKSGNITTFY